MMTTVNNYFPEIIEHIISFLGIESTPGSITNTLITLAIVLTTAFLLYIILRVVLINMFTSFAKKTKTKWDDIMIEQGLNKKLINTTIIFFILTILPSLFPVERGLLENIIIKVCKIALVTSLVSLITGFINFIKDYTSSRNKLRKHPLKGLFQVLIISVYFIATILIVAIIWGKSPITLFTALGAIAAVLLLIFKDTILGFVAGVQLSANDMLREGDWISVPKYNADGEVIDVSLNTVKIKNWDNTISMVPPYALVSDSFQNWRGMSDSLGRRVKRSINIDMRSVKFCDDAMIEKFKQIDLISDYVEKTQKEINKANKEGMTSENYYGHRAQTNLGIFRAYLTEYLKHKPEISKKLTSMVRQLQPTEKGIPLELYFFSSIKSWVEYEGIQSDVFDHLLAIIPHFELRVYQDFSGGDVRTLLEEKESSTN